MYRRKCQLNSLAWVLTCYMLFFFLKETPKSLLHDASILDQWTCKSISLLATCNCLNWVDSFSAISSRNLPFYSSFYQIITITTTDVALFSYFFRTCLMKHQLTINEEWTPPKLKPLSVQSVMKTFFFLLLFFLQ